jgi:hypothetical protein
VVEPASVIGVQKLKPCGTAVAGMLLPRENEPVELVPRVVSTHSEGRACATGCGAPSMRMSSTQPLKRCGPSGLS